MKYRQRRIIVSLLCTALLSYLYPFTVRGEEAAMEGDTPLHKEYSQTATPSEAEKEETQETENTAGAAAENEYSISCFWESAEPEVLCTPSWNPDTHSYEGWEFTSRTLVIENTSNKDTAVSLELHFTPQDESIQGGFSFWGREEDRSSYLDITLEAGEQTEVRLSVTKITETAAPGEVKTSSAGVAGADGMKFQLGTISYLIKNLELCEAAEKEGNPGTPGNADMKSAAEPETEGTTKEAEPETEGTTEEAEPETEGTTEDAEPETGKTEEDAEAETGETTEEAEPETDVMTETAAPESAGNTDQTEIAAENQTDNQEKSKEPEKPENPVTDGQETSV